MRSFVLLTVLAGITMAYARPKESQKRQDCQAPELRNPCICAAFDTAYITYYRQIKECVDAACLPEDLAALATYLSQVCPNTRTIYYLPYVVARQLGPDDSTNDGQLGGELEGSSSSAIDGKLDGSLGLGGSMRCRQRLALQ
ncbi:hypothetical protein ONZ51_g3930 [Trametes cubensis]|uniref:Extracellular membrane protein CFEM domain-containing protein n=1 Tax=Trametes cubensis TaxID=1111947 RepID=A0AAD7TWU8_9APHY|nr:hypothetical protein ONZ51_g3930 [Trametes cubensis]